MKDLSVDYMGMTLRNPVIVGSSVLTSGVKGVVDAAEAGAGAVVLKSLFEEDMEAGANAVLDLNPTGNYHAAAYDYIRQTSMLLQPDSTLDFISDAKAKVDIPVIASLNCHTDSWWIDYARSIEKAGADGLELNISLLPSSAGRSSAELEERTVRFVRETRKATTLPLAAKIGMGYTSLPHLSKALVNAGASALVLFNRYVRPDINIDKIALTHGSPLSEPGEFLPVLRWIAILSDTVDASIGANTGIHSAEEVIKTILAGGDVVHICTTLIKNGFGYLKTILNELEEWMEKKGYKSLRDFYSLLSLNDDIERKYFQRLQYLKSVRGQ